MAGIVLLHAWLGIPYWAWLTLFQFKPHWFILTGHCLYCFASLTGSSLLSMDASTSNDKPVNHQVKQCKP
jgi:hypothetical protein